MVSEVGIVVIRILLFCVRFPIHTALMLLVFSGFVKSVSGFVNGVSCFHLW